jgi:hypothetical protein
MVEPNRIKSLNNNGICWENNWLNLRQKCRKNNEIKKIEKKVIKIIEIKAHNYNNKGNKIKNILLSQKIDIVIVMLTIIKIREMLF